MEKKIVKQKARFFLDEVGKYRILITDVYSDGTGTLFQANHHDGSRLIFDTKALAKRVCTWFNVEASGGIFRLPDGKCIFYPEVD